MFSILASLVLHSHSQDAEQVYKTATPSILTVQAQKGNETTSLGTAFLAIHKGLAITAWHVVKGATKITAKFSDGTEANVVGLVDKNPELDIALLRIESGDRPILGLASGDPHVGSRAYVIGSPKGMDFSISDGIISQTPFMGNDKLYQFTCPVSPGNSGGPLLNSAGSVLGVVSWQLKDAQNLSFAIPSQNLGKLDPTKEVQALKSVQILPEVYTDVLVAATDNVIEDVLQTLDLKASKVDDGTGANAFMFESSGTKISLFQYTKEGGSGPIVNLALSTGFNSERRCYRKD